MFDFTSSKLLILGLVALIVVGPKDLPMLLRTIGKYVGMIRRQAAEFRAQFDEAIRESEFDQIKKDVENVGRAAEDSMREAESALKKEMEEAERGVHAAIETQPAPASNATEATAAPEAPPLPALEPVPIADATLPLPTTPDAGPPSAAKSGA